VLGGDTPTLLAERVLAAEHRIYPVALRLVAAGLAQCEGEKVAVSHDVKASLPLYSPNL
jgi:phosphoribosylglycinamide formyltransferase-1